MTLVDIVVVMLPLAVALPAVSMVGQGVLRWRRRAVAGARPLLPARRRRRGFLRRVLRVVMPWVRLAAAILVPGGLGLVIGTAASLALDAPHPRPHAGFLREFLNPAIAFPSDLTTQADRKGD